MIRTENHWTEAQIWLWDSQTASKNVFLACLSLFTNLLFTFLIAEISTFIYIISIFLVVDWGQSKAIEKKLIKILSPFEAYKPLRVQMKKNHKVSIFKIIFTYKFIVGWFPVFYLELGKEYMAIPDSEGFFHPAYLIWMRGTNTEWLQIERILGIDLQLHNFPRFLQSVKLLRLSELLKTLLDVNFHVFVLELLLEPPSTLYFIEMNLAVDSSEFQ